MKWYATEIDAIDPVTGNLMVWPGEMVPGYTKEDAQNYCRENGIGYCRVVGIMVAEIPNAPDHPEDPYGYIQLIQEEDIDIDDN